MELKPGPAAPAPAVLPLLIVPYGIETRYLVVVAYLQKFLLIVPYGIETLFDFLVFCGNQSF